MQEACFHLIFKTDDSLKVKRCTLVITSFVACSNSKVEIKEEKHDSSGYVKVSEANDLEDEVELVDSVEEIVDRGSFQYGPTMRSS